MAHLGVSQTGKVSKHRPTCSSTSRREVDDIHTGRRIRGLVGALAGMKFEQLLRHQRANRWLKSDPVPDELLLELTDLAIRAPSGRNSQNWEFIFVKDPERIAQIGRLNQVAARWYRKLQRKDEPATEMVRGFLHQAESFAKVPVVAVVCQRGWLLPFPLLYVASFFASVFPAVQNLLLAAQQRGLGTTLVTFPLWNRYRLHRILELPWNVVPCCLIPMGWPEKQLGPNRRRPAAEVFHLDRFGKQPFA